MDAQTCLKKLQYVGVLNFATVDKYKKPQIRNISANAKITPIGAVKKHGGGI